ncbi:class I SAM-dependent methyltransferase [Candidatus Nitronereus thalassa]|uniref:Class I SAM-dependent methyltransferase n=1 Tax=Candidatus Nitronereus thalassa TaxID=3020898 RepID=A0ABU3KCW0_9BACT|nr:class I SAM-dependent methyltransferase [Candidatus Nitronereus thalassa]MDT7044102.1 class I SAM-dependent methyltransferase [Candidatus Nitronereus thalassa]
MRRNQTISPKTAPTFRPLPISLTKSSTLLCLAFTLLLGTSGCTDLKRLAYEGFDRDEWQQPEQVIKALKIEPGDQVADLGSGSGYFTFRLADAVGPNGKVYAVDIDAEMNAALAEQVQEKGYQNIEVVLAQPHDPGLPDNSIDLIFSTNTYHHLEQRVAYLANLKQDLQPNGRIAIIDFNGEGWFQHLFGHYTSSESIQRELQETGYTLETKLDFLPKQVFLIFVRN